MTLKIFGDCPWCGARIDLHKVGRDYVCPVCGCTFKRNGGHWVFGLLLASFIAVSCWIFVPVYGRLFAFLGAIAIMALTVATSRLAIQSRGRTDLAQGEAAAYRAK